MKSSKKMSGGYSTPKLISITEKENNTYIFIYRRHDRKNKRKVI